MGFDAAYFTTALAAKGMSKRALARLMRLDASAVSLMLRGKRAMRTEEAAQIADVLGVRVEEVLQRAGVDLAPKAAGSSVPVRGTVGQGAVVTWGAVVGPLLVPPLGEGPVGGLAALRVASGGAWDGWVLYVKTATTPKNEALGRLCVVTLEGGEAIVAPLSRGYEPGKFNLLGWGIGAAARMNVEVERTQPVVAMASF